MHQTDPTEEATIFDNAYPYFEYATSGQRLLNYIIDQVLIKFVLYWAFYFLALGKFPLYNSLVHVEGGVVTIELLNVTFNAILIAIIYFLIEGASGGLTVGKLITGTKAVREDNHMPINWKDALIRSLCRMVPLEPLSGLMGYPWHDRWSKTIVIKTR